MILNAFSYSCFVTAQKFVVKTVKPVAATSWNLLSMYTNSNIMTLINKYFVFFSYNNFFTTWKCILLRPI